MKKLLLSAIAFSVIVLGGTVSAQAKPDDKSPLILPNIKTSTLESILNIQLNPIEQPAIKKPVKYKITEGDSLEKIAKKYKTTWKRLYFKNKSIKNPDQLKVGVVIDIPKANEKLQERSLPITSINTGPVGQNAPEQAGISLNAAPANGTGNFEWGWCTYYAQLMRPDKKFSGNAGEWIVYANSTVPKVGAVAVSTLNGLGHVAIVEAIEPDRILVSQMNWRGFGVISRDWVSRSYWQGYIY